MKSGALGMLAVAALTALAGCGGGESRKAAGTVARVADPVPCGAAAYAGMRGQPLTALPGDEIPGTMRIVLPGDSAAGDFNPMRLNVTLDDSNRIAALSCG